MARENTRNHNHEGADMTCETRSRQAEAVRLALDSVILEQWLRFHWLEETDTGAARLNAPEEVKRQLERDAPHLLPLAERLLAPAETLDPLRIIAIIRDFLREQGAEAALEEASFHNAVTRFHTWVAEHADWLDTRTPDILLWLRAETPPADA